MTETDTRTVVVEREFAHPPAKVWRALTQPHLVAEWLMAGDVAPRLGHRLAFGADWCHVDCEVVEGEPERRPAYTWAGKGVQRTRTWTRTPTGKGTQLRSDQTWCRTATHRAAPNTSAGA